MIKRSNFFGDNFDIENYLSEKDVDFTITNNGDWLKMKCLFPWHEDNHPSFYIHKLHGGYNCYKCGSGSWIDLCEKMGWNDWEDDTVIVDIIQKAIWLDLQKAIRNVKHNTPEKLLPPPYGFKIINKKTPKKFIDYLKKRNLLTAVNEFKIGFTLVEDRKRYGKAYLNRILIPAHTASGKLAWIEGRTILENKKIKYYRPGEVRSGIYLFNYHRVIRAGFRYVIIVEGIIDAITLWLHGYPAVACYKASLSDEQINLLMVFDKVYSCLDIDEAGIKGFVKLKEILKGVGISLYRIMIPRGKDSNTITKEKFTLLFNKAKKVL